MKILSSRKVALSAFFVFVFTLIMVGPSLSRAYDSTHGITVKMNSLGFVPDLADDATNETVFDYISEPATLNSAENIAYAIMGATFNDRRTDYSSCLPYLRSDMISGFTENGVFVFPDNIQTTIEDGTELSSVQIYELALRVLGFNSEDFGTTEESVLEFARNEKFGFVLPVEKITNLYKGDVAVIFYESLFLPVKSSGYSLLRILSETSDMKKQMFLENGMIDDFPDFVPIYKISPYSDESFEYFITAATVESDAKYEWNATYIMADGSCYNGYKGVLESNEWILDTEYKRSNEYLDEICSLYYKTIEGTEHYCLVRFNEKTSVINIWVGI